MNDKRAESIDRLKSHASLLRRSVVIVLWTIREILKTAWVIVREPLITALNIVVALIVLFEEWGWRPLSDLLGRLAKYAPVAALERLIAGLPPYAAFAVIALPTALLFPLKLVSVWLLANGHYATATLLFIAAKVASTALIARIFLLTKPALMRLAWFARAYDWLIPWQEALFAQIRSSRVWRYGRVLKEQFKQWSGKVVARYRSPVATLWRRLTGREQARIDGSSEPPRAP